MFRPYFAYTLVTIASILCAPTAQLRAANHANSPEIFFDLPLVTAAVPSACDEGSARLVDIELRLSSMIVAPDPKKIDQWIVRCQPRGDEIQVADYAPRTEVASGIQGPIQIKQTDERSESVGLSIDGTYGQLARGNAGMDRGSKKIESLQYDRVAPVQAVTASGTINRGRGVYFKLKWTEQQVLEGEKTFRLTLSVPQQWRSGLVDVSVIAQSEQKSFAGWDRDVVTLGRANFVVAVHDVGDNEAMRAAKSLAAAEDALRRAAAQSTRSTNAIAGLVRNVTNLFDSKPSEPANQWVERLLREGTNPHADKQILELPVATRMVALDYCDARETFVSLNQGSQTTANNHQAENRYAAAKAAVVE
ncbi:hypothetical protein [Novipirellula artificiosorum]|uniref:Uncharacterized protein n=1 Tax=Novipirellula artificiosorum TaxID=2528016 RepID=A0A5C6DQK3_9BACT|nr:hypothetical protein [Novipirellula artificiosorum]TWU37296.1 hypothetical protein Poly41_34250 [Novipirellula artificiosorum]